MMNRKGMSPLIATVLLIAFAVALGAMIMNWSTGFDGPVPSPGDECGFVKIELNRAFGKDLFCYDQSNIKFNIVNSGDRIIDGIQLRTLDAYLNEVKQSLPSSSMPVGETFVGDLPYDKSGKVHVEIVPFIMVNKEAKYCLEKRIVQDVLPNC